MKKIKYLVLIIIVLLFSGCSGDYNLTFNRDLSVNEELRISIENDSDNYERTYDLIKNAGLDENDINVSIVQNEVKIVYKKDYDSFEEYYLNSSLYKMLFEDIGFTKDNVGMTINAESVLKLDDKDSPNIINSYDIDNFKINLIVPFNVKKNNADKVSDNIYTWTLNKSDTYKQISIDYDYKNASTISIVMLVLIGIASLIIIFYVVNTIIKNRRI